MTLPPRNGMRDLFDPVAGKAGKDEGMERVLRAADHDWVAQMYMHAYAVALSMPHFTADDVHRRALRWGMTATTRDQRAFGPIMMRLAKENVCCKADRAPVNSQRRTLHCSPVRVWRSLIYQGPKP